MQPATNTLILRRNADTVEEWQILDETGLPRDLTGWTELELQVRQYGAQPGDAALTLGLVSITVTGIRLLEPAFGILEVRVEQSVVAPVYDAYDAGSEAGSALEFVFDLRALASTGERVVLVEGPVIINPGVTI